MTYPDNFDQAAFDRAHGSITEAQDSDLDYVRKMRESLNVFRARLKECADNIEAGPDLMEDIENPLQDIDISIDMIEQKILEAE